MSNHDYNIFTQLLNVSGTWRVWVLKRVHSPGRPRPSRASGYSIFQSMPPLLLMHWVDRLRREHRYGEGSGGMFPGIFLNLA